MLEYLFNVSHTVFYIPENDSNNTQPIPMTILKWHKTPQLERFTLYCIPPTASREYCYAKSVQHV